MLKFDKAYCEETAETLTPYHARDIYFDETSDYYGLKLTFRCEDPLCRARITGVNLYATKKVKIPPHFRTWPDLEHAPNCELVKAEEASSGSGNGGRRKGEKGFKTSRFPSKLLLERPQSRGVGKTTDATVEETTVEPRGGGRGVGRTPPAGPRQSPLVTSFLEHVVDCYNCATPEERERNRLTIRGKTLHYKNFFKKIIYFRDGEGLIYFGPVGEVKRYGDSYRIVFRDRIRLEGKKVRVSIFLRKDVIAAYRRSRLMRETLIQMSASSEEIDCYFVGAYPELCTVRYSKNGEELEFEEFQVEITNLDHLVVTFSGRVEINGSEVDGGYNGARESRLQSPPPPSSVRPLRIRATVRRT